MCKKMKKLIDFSILSGSLFFIVLLLHIISASGCAVKLSDILKQAEGMHAKYDKEFDNVISTRDEKMITDEGEIFFDTKVYSKGDKSRTEQKIRMGDQYQMKDEMALMEHIFIKNDKEAWTCLSLGGFIVEKKKLSDKEFEKFNNKTSWWKRISEESKLLGMEKVNNRDCYVIAITDQNHDQFNKIWVDNKSYLIMKEVKRDGENTVIEIYLDIRNIKGDLILPFRYEKYENGEFKGYSQIKTIEMNQDFSDNLFELDNM